MRNISTQLKNHFAQEAQTVCTLWKITRKDGNVFGFTDFNKNIEYQNIEYISSTGYMASAIKHTAKLNVDNLELTAPLNNIPTSINDVTEVSGGINEADLQAGLWDNAYVVIMEVNYENLTMWHAVLKAGYLGKITTGRTTYTAEMRGIPQALAQTVGRVYTAGCNANLGDNNCRVNLASITFDGTVSKLIDQRSWVDFSLNQTNSTYQKSITAITKTNPIQITVPAHGLQSGESIIISGITGMIELNGFTKTITYVDADNFTIAVDGTNYTDYINGGYITKAIVSEYFKDGFVEWLTGNNAGIKSDIKTYTPNNITLYDNLIFPIQIGDTYKIRAGCDKLASTCHTRFNNIVNFYGFNLVPGQDRIMSGT